MDILKNAALGASAGLGLAVMCLAVLGEPPGPPAYQCLAIFAAVGGIIGTWVSFRGPGSY